MSAMLCEKASKAGKVTDVLRVSAGERYLGDVLLRGEQVWRHVWRTAIGVLRARLRARWSRRSSSSRFVVRLDVVRECFARLVWGFGCRFCHLDQSPQLVGYARR